MRLSSNWTWAKEALVLTSDEKRVISFVIAAFLLGAGTKCYRDAHPKTPVKIEKKRVISRPARGGRSSKRE